MHCQSLIKKEVAQEIEKISLWEDLLKKSIIDELQLYSMCKEGIEIDKLKAVIKKYPMRINPYYLSLIKTKDDAIWKQCVPDTKELEDQEGLDDPLCEELNSPVSTITHVYPDRALLLVSNQCAMYCRFCTRKRKVGDPFKRVTKEQIMKGIDYIKTHPEIRDIVLTGGDPLLVSDTFLESILKELKEISHIEMIRIGSRVLCSLPQRITPELCQMLKKYHPLYINTHFNHPDEITPLSKKACEMLADAGIPLSNQTVLLKGVNDNPETMKKLVHELLKIRVRPYYIYQADLTKGTHHFRTPVETGIDIMKSMIGHTSGLAIPHFVIDAAGGGGKVPVTPEYLLYHDQNYMIVKNYKGDIHKYPQPKN
jgi:lysine 2,3-aminomutase